MAQKRTRGRVRNRWKRRPRTTVSTYRANIWAVDARAWISRIRAAIREAIPIGEYLERA